MRVIVIGAGFTGVQLARKLLAEKRRVVLIDSDAERVRDVGNQLDCAVVHSAGNSLDVLEKAGIASADVLVAVSASDEVNMIACSLADAVYPQVLKIARVRNYAYYAATEEASRKFSEMSPPPPGRPPFGIDWMVNPDVEAAKAVTRALAHGAVGGIVELGHGYCIVTLTLGAASPLNGLPLWRLATVEGWHYLVAHVEGQSGAVLPGGETVLSAGDRIGVLVKLDEVAAAAALCDAGSGVVSKMAVVGAGRIGTMVVEGQRGDGRSFVGHFRGGWNADSRMEIAVIDEAADRCRAVAERFRGVRVFCGDSTDENLIREERLDRYDLAVAVSENYDRNLVTAAYMKSCGVGRSIALTANADVAGMALKLGVDVAVPMRATVVDSIMSHLRGRNVTGVHTVCKGAFEIVECSVDPTAKAAGKALRDLEIGGSGLVLMVHGADGTSVVPKGDTVVDGGASVVLIVPAGDMRAVGLFAG